MLVDPYHRHITYLRLSLTDRCNLRCQYCMPETGVEKLSHDQILTYEEFLRVARAAAAEGMTKIRLTGGEPLVRKGVLGFISDLSRIEGLMDLRMTTNGVLLAEKAADLRAAGISRINVSLDSLDREKYRLMTGRDYLDRVLKGIDAALEAGFDQVKINVVLVRGLNDNEAENLASLSLDRPLEVRFIEFMPLGREGYWSPEKMVTTAETMDRLRNLGEIREVGRAPGEGPARLYQIEGAAGKIGFISALTDHFCATCNRLRLTADGKLRLCLLSNLEVDLKKSLRSGAGLEELAAILRQAVKSKPMAHLLNEDAKAAGGRSMNLIGG